MSFPAQEMESVIPIQTAVIIRTTAQMVLMRRTASSVSQATSIVEITAVCLKVGFAIPKMTVEMEVMKRTVQWWFLPES